MVEHLDRFRDFARGDPRANLAGGNHPPIHDHRRDDLQRTAGGITQRSQRLYVSGSVMAEEKVGAFHQTAGVELVEDDVPKKLIRCELQQGVVGRIDDDRVDAVLLKQCELVIE